VCSDWCVCDWALSFRRKFGVQWIPASGKRGCETNRQESNLDDQKFASENIFSKAVFRQTLDSNSKFFFPDFHSKTQYVVSRNYLTSTA
jgi:hypothetical protein